MATSPLLLDARIHCLPLLSGEVENGDNGPQLVFRMKVCEKMVHRLF